MNISGLNYYFSGLYLPSANWVSCFDFYSQSGRGIPSSSGANTLNSGVLNGVVSLAVSGTGFFNGNSRIDVTNYSGDFSSWTIMGIFEKKSSGDGVIFSNYSSGSSSNSGFVIGLNAANRIYLESYNEDGPSLYEASLILGNKNLLSFSKHSNSILISYLNGNLQNVENEYIQVRNGSFSNSNRLSVGGYSGSPSYFSGSYFSGTMEGVSIMDTALQPDEIGYCMLGMASNISAGVPVLNTGILESLAMDRVVSLSNLDASDLLELFAPTGKINKSGFNLDAIYDRVNGEFSLSDDSSVSGETATNIFRNGAFQVPASSYQVTESYENTYYDLTGGSYINSGRRVIANDLYNGDDNIVYDRYDSTGKFFITGFSHLNSDYVAISGTYLPKPFVFFNGVKLIGSTGVLADSDYVTQYPNTAFFSSSNSLYGGATGTLSILSSPADYEQIYAGAYQPTVARFPRNSSILFRNGIRQNKDENYLESASIDLLGGSGGFIATNESFFVNDFS